MAILANSITLVPQKPLTACLFMLLACAWLGLVLEMPRPRGPSTPRPGPVRVVPVCLLIAAHVGRGGCYA